MLRIIIIFVLALLLGSCALMPQRVEQRAADYYSFQVGHLPKAKYSSFLSPAYRAIADKAGLSELDAAMRKATSPSARYQRIKGKQVTVQRDGNFALSTVDSALGGTFRDGKPLRWVRDGGKWYLYLGSDAEVGKYGVFPSGLVAEPVVPRQPANAPPLLKHGQQAPTAAAEAAKPAAGQDAPPATGEAQAPPAAGEGTTPPGGTEPPPAGDAPPAEG